MERDPHHKWTETTRFIDRHLWKAPTPTSRQKGPVETKGRRGPPKEHRRKAPGKGLARKEEAPAKAALPAPERDAHLPQELVFKPFNLLTGETDKPKA
jgi:3'-5' exoribonuclease